MEVRRVCAVNLLLINYEYPPIGGGAGNATLFIARALRRLGHSASVLTSAFGGNAGTSEDDGVVVDRLNVKRRRADRASSAEMLSFAYAAYASAPAIAAERRADGAVVFFTLPCGPVALQVQRKQGIPYVVSLRGGDVPGLVPEIAAHHWVLAPLRRKVLRSARAIVANDNGLAKLSMKADPFPVIVIPNGVDTQFFPPRAAHEHGGPTRIIFVGRFHRQKNLSFLLEQMARLNAAEPGGWLLSLVGDGEERAALIEKARRLELTDIIAWHGWQEDKTKLRDLYCAADVLVNPSHYEGMPNTLLEAMACALPVVASAVPGNDTLVSDGKTGCLFSPGDGDAFCKALRSLRDSPELAKAMGAEGRSRVEREFSWDTVATRYVALFDRG
jgi:glycosyltransferase involved in cell wall biosynthesis